MPFDVWSGLNESGMATPGCRRMLALAGMSWSFDTASERLEEFCLLKVSNDTIRRVSEKEGQGAEQWISKSAEPGKAFEQAEGEQEFYTDGVTVNTTEGWRDLRLNVVAKRESGPPATTQQWKDRVLPEPGVRIAWASLAACQQQGLMWRRMSKKLGMIDDETLSVLADGAKWIWDQATRCWKKAQWVLDVFHVSQHIHDCGKELFGENNPRTRPWSETQMQNLMEQGPVRYLQNLKATQPDAGKSKAVQALLGYLEPNVDSLWYKQRLLEGRPIGSGLIEGANKTIVSNRLKLNSARWKPKHAEQIAALRCLDYSNLWSAFWSARAA